VVSTSANSKFKCFSKTLKFGTVLSNTFGSLPLRKSSILASLIFFGLMEVASQGEN